MRNTDFIELEDGTLVNINHIIAVDELKDGNALIVMSNEMYAYEDSRGKDVIHDLINECYGLVVRGESIINGSDNILKNGWS